MVEKLGTPVLEQAYVTSVSRNKGGRLPFWCDTTPEYHRLFGCDTILEHQSEALIRGASARANCPRVDKVAVRMQRKRSLQLNKRDSTCAWRH